MNEQKYSVYFGRLGRNPELRRTQDGGYVCDFSLAINQGREEAIWRRVVCWGDTAQKCSQRLKKGNEVFVRGKESERSFTDQSGKNKSYMEVAAHLIGFTNT